MEANLKRRVLIAASFGAGVIVAAALITSLIVWYESRPKSPVPWNTTALIAQEPPGFGFISANDRHLIRFSYVVKNTTARDYDFDPVHVKLMIRYADGTLAGPLSATERLLQSAFIPAKQSGHIHITTIQREAPEQLPGEPDHEYHERLRAYLNSHWAKVSGFVLYDDENHYQLNLPRWRSGGTEAELPAEK